MELIDIGGYMIFIGLLLGAPTNLILHIALRKEKARIAWHIIDNASDEPKALKVVLRRSIYWNMSWVFASTFIYTWLGLLLAKIFVKATLQDAKRWHRSIKESYGKWRYAVYIMQLGFNFFLAGMIVFHTSQYLTA